MGRHSLRERERFQKAKLKMISTGNPVWLDEDQSAERLERLLILFIGKSLETNLGEKNSKSCTTLLLRAYRNWYSRSLIWHIVLTCFLRIADPIEFLVNKEYKGKSKQGRKK